MSALDRLNSYSARGTKLAEKRIPSVFDVSTPSGAFLEGVHLKGFAMYNREFLLRDELHLSDDDYSALSEEEQSCYDKSLKMSESDYFASDDETKSRYVESVEYTELYKVITTAGNQVINAVAGSGKALHGDVGVMTSVGSVPIKELQVGDEVFGVDGKLHKVVGFHPQGRKRVYNVKVGSQAVIPACKDHIWGVCMYNLYHEMTTLELMEWLKKGKRAKLPLVNPIEYAHVPYIDTEDSTRIFVDRKAYIESDYENKIYLDPYQIGAYHSSFYSGVIDDVFHEEYDEFGVTDTSYIRNNMEKYDKKCELFDFILYNSSSIRWRYLSGIVDINMFKYSRDYFYGEYDIGRNYVVCHTGNNANFEALLDSLAIPHTFRNGHDDIPDYFIVCPTRKTGYFHELTHNDWDIRLGASRNFKYISGIRKTTDFAEMYCIEVDSPDHLFLLDGCIPTHNTTALVLKILYDIVTGEAMTLKAVPGGNTVRVVNNMWVCTFLRSGAKELEDKLSAWQRRMGYSQTASQVSFSTMDAEFKRCLNAMGVATPLGDASQLSGLFKKAVDSCGITRDGGYALNKEDYNILSSIIVYYRGRLDSKRYQHPSCVDYGLTPTILDLLVSQYASLRKSAGVMDFEQIMELLYQYLYVTPNKAVQDFVSSRYNFIYIDEFQDTSQMAYAILKYYNRGKLWMNTSGVCPTGDEGGLYTGVETLGKLLAVGDVSQCIYSFRGSDSRILSELIDKDFRPTLNTLSVNWRCPSNILNPVVPSIHINADSAKQGIIPAKEGGEFAAYQFPNFKAMLRQLKDDIAKDMEEGNTVAILCRTNFDGMIPAFMLEADKSFDFSISGDNMTLSSPLPKKIVGVSALFTERSTPAVKAALEFFSGRSNGWAVKQLMDVLKTNGKTIWQLPEEDIKYSCYPLLEFVQMVKKVIMPDGKNRDKSKEIEALRLIYSYMIVNTFAGDSAYCASARAYLETLLYIMEERDFKTVYDFLEEIDFLNDSLHGRIKKSRSKIKIATVHEFKGKESDSVYIWNDSDGVFPSNKCDIEDEEQLNEERRVHYIACTRARKREHIYTLGGRVGMFVREMDLAIESPQNIGVTLNK